MSLIIMKIGERLQDSFNFTHEALFGNWVRWIMLVISSIVFPIFYGYSLQIMRGIQPAYEEESFFRLFIDGFKLFIIYLLYMVVPLLAFCVTVGYALFGIILTGEPLSLESLLPMASGLFVGLVITIILWIIFMLLSVVGSVRYARTNSMQEAFAFGKIIETIGKIGWGNYIVSLIVLFIIIGIIAAVVTIIEIALAFIPIIGIIIGWIISFFLGPYLGILSSRFYSLLYDEAEQI